MKRILKVFTVLLLVIYSDIYAQDEFKVIRNAKTDKEAIDMYDWPTWNIKTDLVSIVACDFPLIFEYFVTKNFSIEAGLGITNVWSYFLYEEVLTLENSRYRYKGGWKPSYVGAVKYYPWRHKVRGFSSDMYFGVQGFSKSYIFNIQDLDYPALDGYSDNKQSSGLGFIYGFYARMGKYFYGEFQIGISYRTYQHTRHFYVDNHTNPYIYALQDFDKKPLFILGVRYGFVK